MAQSAWKRLTNNVVSNAEALLFCAVLIGIGIAIGKFLL